MRLIDADALMDSLWNQRRSYQLLDDSQTADKIMHGLYRAEQIIHDAPTIEERKTGKWIRTDELWTDMFTADEERIYKCSVCGENVIGKPDWRFCPCCGAYMRGNKNE